MEGRRQSASEPNFRLGEPFQELWNKLLTERRGDQSSRPIIYHYTDVDGLVGMVKSNRLWASDVLFMNDAAEIHYGRRLIISVASAAAERTSSAVVRTLLQSMGQILYEVDRLTTAFFVACFSAEDDLLSQWRGYSGRSGGYAVGFHVDELGSRTGNRTPAQGFSQRRVIYKRDHQIALVASFLDGVSHIVEDLLAGSHATQEVVATARSFVQVATIDFLLTLKHPKFEEEKEWRIVHQHRGFGVTTGSTVEYRPTHSFVVPYVALDISPDHGPRANLIPTGRIVVGPTPHQREAAAAVRALVAHIPEVEVVNSEIPLRS